MNYKEKLTKTQILGSSIGALGGIYYAFTQKSGFWGYAGYFILGSLAGSLTGNVVSIAFKQNDKEPLPPVEKTDEEHSGIKKHKKSKSIKVGDREWINTKYYATGRKG